ncbi:MAG: transcription antitermination factor NusB [Flavobacteriales bacterium]|nr:transcription antitermination factor NusB [Flavobacteriales bacterium]
MQALYGAFQSDSEGDKSGRVELENSIDRIYELYILLLHVLGEVVSAAKVESGLILKRHIPAEDKEPHKKLIENSVMQKLRTNRAILAFSEKYNVTGVVEEELPVKIFNRLKKSDFYKSYKVSDPVDFEEEKAFVLKVFRKFVCTSEELVHLFEEENIHWADDIELAKISVAKTITDLKSSSDENYALQKLYKDEKGDSQFAVDLFNQTINRSQEIQKLLEGKTKNWDQDRVAMLDNLLMKMALSEVLHFKTIPVKVSMNEYIEISKKYSTPKSGSFINGILDNVISDLKKGEKIKKVGRGLVN